MNVRIKKIVIIFISICFVLTATNIVLALHLVEHHHDKSHNPENCPICQQGVIIQNSAVLQSHPKVCQVNEILFTLSYRNFFSLQIGKFQLPPSHAPPSVC
jgi:hypothetical protein